MRTGTRVHTHIADAAAKKRQALDAQFDLLTAAVESKRRQLKDQISMEETDLQSDIARDLLGSQELSRHTDAAIDILRHSGATPSAMQLATVASARALELPQPPKGSADPMSKYQVSLEGIVERVHALTFGRLDSDQTLLREESVSRSFSPRVRSKVSFAAAHSSKAGPTILGRPQSPTSAIMPSTPIQHSVEGSCIFNAPLQNMIKKTCMVEWRLKIDDHGDWVGAGVAVGAELADLATGAAADTRHLWIAPAHFPRILRLRISVGPHNHAKLTIHDNNGNQLDDNRVPHWPVNKPCFPQVSFGKVKGKVTMLDPPHVEPLRTTR